MMQKVQRWSQPCWIWTKARARPSKPSTRCAAVSPHRHDVGDDDRRAIAGEVRRGRASRRCPAPGRPPAWRRSVCGSIWAAQPVTMMRRSGMLAAQLADRLARLAHRLAGDGAGVDDDRRRARPRRASRAHHLGLEGVQPAAEGDDQRRRAIAAAGQPASAGSSTPVKAESATGPVISTWSSRSHSMRRLAAVEHDRDAALGQAAPRRRRRRRRRRRCRRPG